MSKLVFSGRLRMYEQESRRYLSSCGKVGNLSTLPAGGYYSMVLHVQNQSTSDFRFGEACVRVDGGPAWHWRAGTIEAGSAALFSIAHVNMQTCMTPGAHTVVWYFDQAEVHREEFFFYREMPWEDVFPFPTRRQINNHQNPRGFRAPYVACWLDIPHQERYTEYQIDFQAGHLPTGTYCSLGNWKMDHRSLKKRYQSVRTESSAVHGYAGFQRLADGTYASIMSFWDVFCTDFSGKEHRLRAKLMYPQKLIGVPQFSGEGTGARCIAPFDWKERNWYRMHLRSFVSPETGTTLVEQWVTDLHTGERKLLCCYDTLIPDSCFCGSAAIFLENFTPATAAEVRSMEAYGIKYRSADHGCWKGVTGAYMYYQDAEPWCEGSYRFGASGKHLWMITSGVGGNWFRDGKGVKHRKYSLDAD